MSIMVDNIDVTKCSSYKDGKCRSLTHLVQGEYINCNSMCDYGAYARKEQLKRLQAENEQMKEEITTLECKLDAKKPSMIIPKPKQLAVPIKEVETYLKAFEEIRNYLNTLSSVDSDFPNTETYLRVQDKINEVLR